MAEAEQGLLVPLVASFTQIQICFFFFEEMGEFHLAGRGNDPPLPTSPSVLAVRSSLPLSMFGWFLFPPALCCLYCIMSSMIKLIMDFLKQARHKLMFSALALIPSSGLLTLGGLSPQMPK